MQKDRRYATCQKLVAGGHIKMFRDLFDIIPKSVVARDVGMNNVRFSKLIVRPELLQLKDIFKIALLVGTEETTMLGLIVAQYLADKKKRAHL